VKPWDSYFQDGMAGAVTGIIPRSAADVTMSADRLTAFRALTNLAATYVAAIATQSGLYNCYAEVTVNAAAGNMGIGICNRRVTTGDPSGSGYPGNDNNSIGWGMDSTVRIGGVTIATTSTNIVAGNTVAIAVNGPQRTIQFRNVTQSSAWFGPYSIVPLGPPPYYLDLGIQTVGDNAKANFFGPFLGTPPPGPPPGFLNWNPEALSSEQPVKVLDFEAVIADGSYSSTNVNDLVAMPFSYIRWGDADLDAKANLRFTDWVLQGDDDDDWPLLSVTITATAAPGDNYIWGQWDGGSTFLIIRFRITATGDFTVSNIPIPPPQVTAPNLGEGHVLALFISCDNPATFSWKNGRVFGTENALVWTPIEYATFPPSALGIAQPIILANVIQTGRMGPPIGPPLGS
jgi:hypothetical protein